jgi:hypothetical protein
MTRTLGRALTALALALAGCAGNPPATTAPGGPATDADDGAALRAEFAADPAAAARKWEGTRVRITAAVTQVDPNEGEPYLELAGPILVVPDPSNSAQFGRLKAGAVVTVEGAVAIPSGPTPLRLLGAALVPPGR